MGWGSRTLHGRSTSGDSIDQVMWEQCWPSGFQCSRQAVLRLSVSLATLGDGSSCSKGSSESQDSLLCVKMCLSTTPPKKKKQGEVLTPGTRKCNHIWEKGLYGCNLLRGGHVGLDQGEPYSQTIGVLIRTESGDLGAETCRDTRKRPNEEGNRLELCCHTPRRTKNFQKPPEARQKQGSLLILPYSPRRQCALLLILYLKPLEL